MKNLKQTEKVSVIIPCRNESEIIGRCLGSVLANDYPKENLEILVVDGMSTDGTREILKRHAESYPFIRTLDNPKINIPAALNVGITAATGKILVRMDAHSTYVPHYISRLVERLEDPSILNVGGIWKTVPRNKSLLAQTICEVLSTPFGVGPAHYRTGKTSEMAVDTVPFFCCRREVFDRVGLFNEKILRSEDMEFNSRLKKILKGRILMVGNIVGCYFPRVQFWPFFHHNLLNGFWAIYPLKYLDHLPVKLRHLIPFFAVLTAILLTGLSPFFHPAIYLLVPLCAVYLLLSLFWAVQIAHRGRRLLFLPLAFALFPILHASYGLGSLGGLIRILLSWEFWTRHCLPQNPCSLKKQ